MDNFQNIPVVPDDLESWLETPRYCENCQKLSKTIKDRETVLRKLKSKIISNDKIFKQFQLKKNELGKTQQQLLGVTERLKKSEKINQALQSNVANLLKRNPPDQAKKLAEKDSTIKILEERLKFTQSEQKLFKQSSETSLTDSEKLRDEIKRLSKLIQSLETNQKRKTAQLEKSKKEIEENKSSLVEMRKVVRSLKKELTQLKEKKDRYFQILLDNGLLPKKEILAANRKKNTDSCKAFQSVDFMSDEDDDDDDVQQKVKVKAPESIDVESIMEEFRSIPRMLSPLPLSENELDSSLDGSEKSVNDLAKLLELEFLQSSNLPSQESDNKPTEIVTSKTEFVNPVKSSTNPKLTNSLNSSLSNSDSKKNSLADQSIKHSNLAVLGSADIGHLSSDSSDEEEKTKSSFKSNPSASVLPINRSNNCPNGTEFSNINNTSSNFADKEKLKTSSQLTHPQLESSSDNSLNSLTEEHQQKSPKLFNSLPPSISKSSSIVPLSEDKVCKVNGLDTSSVSTVLPDKQNHDSNLKPDSIKTNKESTNDLDQSKAAKNNLDSVEQITSSEKHLMHSQTTSFKSDMINLFGSEYLSSSSDSDEEKTSEDPNPTDKIKSITSVETNHKDIHPEGKMLESSITSINTDSKNPTSIINNESEKSLPKSETSISFPKEKLSEVNSSLNNEAVEKASTSKLPSSLVEQNSALNDSGDSKNDPCAFPKMLQTDLKNKPCLEHAKNSDQNPEKNLPPPSSEICVISEEIDQATPKEVCLFDRSSLDNNVKNVDDQINPEISGSKSGLPDTEDPTNSSRSLKDTPEKASTTSDLQENQESAAIDKDKHTEISAKSFTDTPELMVTDNREENKKIPLNSLSKSSLEEKSFLESTKNCSIDREIFEVTMTRNSDSFERNQNLASSKEKDQNESSDKMKPLVKDDLIDKSVKLTTVDEPLTSEKSQVDNKGKDENNKTLHQLNENTEDLLKENGKNIVSVDACASSTEELQIKTKKEPELLELSENGKDTEYSSHLLASSMKLQNSLANSTEIQYEPTENSSELNISSGLKTVENCCIPSVPDMNPCLEITSSKDLAVNNSSFKTSSIDEIMLKNSESVSNDPCTNSGDNLQVSYLSSGEKSADVPRKSDKMISPLENKSISKKPSVLTETDINKVDQLSSLTFPSEKGSPDLDAMFDAADSLLSLSSHGTINGSLSSDKENELNDLSDKSILNGSDLKKSNKTEESVANSTEETEDCEYVKNDKKFDNSSRLSESSKDAESLTNSTDNIPKRLSSGSSSFSENGNSEVLKDGSKENGENSLDFNKIPQNTKIAEISKKFEEIGSRLSSSSSLSEMSEGSEILRNDLENGKRHESFEDIKKCSNLTNSLENNKEIGASTDSENLKNCVNDERVKNLNQLSERCVESGSLRNGTEKNDEKNENLGDSESLKNIKEKNGKELGRPVVEIATIEASESLKNDTKEITKNIHNLNGVCKDTEITDPPSKNDEKSTNNELEFVDMNLESKDVSNEVENKESKALAGGDDIITTNDDSVFISQNENVKETLSISMKENDKKYESLGNLESSKTNIEEENGKELSSFATIEISESPKNDTKEITKNIRNSNGMCKDIEIPDPTSKNDEKSTNNELEFVGVNLESKDVSNEVENKEIKASAGGDDIITTNDNSVFSGRNDNAEGTLSVNKNKSQSPTKNEVSDFNDSLDYSVSKDLSSMDEFSDFESTELLPVVNKKPSSPVNMNDLFGDDDPPDIKMSVETVKVPEPKSPTSCLSNDTVSSVSNCDSSVDAKIQNSVPLVVNKVRPVLDDTKKQNECSFSVLHKKRRAAFKMATAPIKPPKIDRKSIDSDKLYQARKEAVISMKINFVASSERFLPRQIMDPTSHDNSSPSIKEEKKKDEVPVEPISNSLFRNSLPSSKTVSDFPENTDHLQLQNNTEQLFARESKGDNSEDICELMKEFILVTGPISPLPMTPEKSVSQFHNNCSTPQKQEINLNTSTPISSPSYCDHLIDLESIINRVPQISPIVTPKKLRENRKKKCLLKEFVSEDGTENSPVNVAKPFPKTFTADTDSGNAENKTQHLLNSDSSNSHQSKPTAAVAAAVINCNMQVDASQPSVDKKSSNIQQRLLRKTRALRHISLPVVTSKSEPKKQTKTLEPKDTSKTPASAKAVTSKSESKKQTKPLEPKDISKTPANAKVPAPSSNPQKIDISSETIPTPTAEEFKAPKKKLMDSTEPEKVSSLGDSANKKKSVRKRKIDITESLSDKLPDKKQCTKNNAILSRARTSIMKVVDREFQTYWKYESSPPAQVLQKLLQTNREAELIVEVVALQAVKQLSSTTDNMMPWYVTKSKSNIPTPYFSDKEKHLMRLLCHFKRKKDMDHIFSKFRNCLKDALTKQDWDSTSLGKWSLCRMYIATCRLEGLLSEVRVFFYTSFCQLPCDQYITLAVVTACTWPLVLSYERIDGYVSLFRVIEYAVIKSVKEKPHNKKYLECLVKHCKWKPSGNNKNNDVQKSLFNQLHDCIETGATKDEIFSYVKAVELLSLQEKWLWTTSLLRSRICHLLKRCLQFEPPEERKSEFNFLLCHIFQMLGNLCMKSKKRDKTITFVITVLLKPFLISDKFSSDVHLCCSRTLMNLYPFEPSIVYPILETWFAENIMWEPASRLMSQWILLKDQLNKEIGVT